MKRREFLKYTSRLSVLTGFGFSSGFSGLMANTSMPSTGLFLDEQLLMHQISLDHPESPARYLAIKRILEEKGLISKTAKIQPVDSIQTWLRTIHTEAHINSIRENYGAKADENIRLVTAGLLGAVDQVCSAKLRNAFCASRPPGHHALNTGREEGFCYYNHIAIAARYAQQQYKLQKILIVDWDYHHGNGTEAAFYDDPSVLYFSTHDADAYPLTGSEDRKGTGAGEGYNINVHLACGATDKDIIQAFMTNLLPAADKFKPDLILISAGFDSRVDDLLGCHNVTDQGFVQLTNILKKLADKYCQSRVVSVLEGGYNIEGNASAVAAHVTALMQEDDS